MNTYFVGKYFETMQISFIHQFFTIDDFCLIIIILVVKLWFAHVICLLCLLVGILFRKSFHYFLTNLLFMFISMKLFNISIIL